MDQLTINQTIPSDLDMYGGVMSIETKNNDTVEYLLMQNSFYGISSAVKYDDKIIMGSWRDKGVLICEV